LVETDKVKYYIHDVIKTVLPNCKVPADLKFALQKFGIELEYKHKRTSNEIEGVSFRYNNISFKGSQVDRKFSFGNLKKEFQKNIKRLQEQAQPKAEQPSPPVKRNLIIKGVELTDKQQEALMSGGHIFLENMLSKDGKTCFSAYLFLNDDRNKAFFSKEHPDTFVEYGKYEMRVRDKILIEAGFIAKAKVKWYGGGFAYPYLWKTDKSDAEYKENWRDPRIIEEQKPENKQVVKPKHPKKNKGKGM
jgi:hypothetical protein